MASEQTIDGKPKVGAGAFITETRREMAKVTWPTRREVIVTTGSIVGLALVAGLFFLLVDNVLGYGVSRILGMQ
jgi:preprotein translocase subunit SecE